MEPSARTVPGADDLGLHLHDWGGSGPPLLFLHGYGHDGRVWDEVVPAFVEAHAVLALDLRGHGGSDRDPHFRYHHVATARDVKAVLSHLGLAGVTVVAHSTAGHAMIGLVPRNPGLVARLALVDAGPRLVAEGRGGTREATGPDDRAGDGAAPDGAGPAGPSFADPAEYVPVLARHYPRAAASTLERLARQWTRPRGDGRYELTLDPAFTRPRTEKDAGARRSFDRAEWAREGEQALWADLARIEIPTLVVRGAESTMLPADTVERMLTVLARGTAAEVPAAGHAIAVENPAGLTTALGDWLAATA